MFNNDKILTEQNTLKECLLSPCTSIKQQISEEILSKSKESEIILFGAGSGGYKLLEFIKENIPNVVDKVKCFADNNPLVHNTIIDGKIVLSPKNALENYTNELILISCGEGDVITQQLLAFGIPCDRIYIPDVATILESDVSFIFDHVDMLDTIFQRLEDKKSKQVFLNILNYKLTHNIDLIKEIADKWEDQYFDKKLIHFSKDDIFLDCGSYVGDTIESYIKHNCNVYNKIICFETDNDNIESIRKMLSENPESRIELYDVAVYNQKAFLKFDKRGSGSGMLLEEQSPRSMVVEVKADTIDHILKGESCTFIKMDIEGAEYKALLGAFNTICKFKPTLMISVYHKQDDFITIPLLILSMNCNYKLYMRHYRSASVQETVLYAV